MNGTVIDRIPHNPDNDCTRDLFRGRQVAQVGAFLAGSSNNGAHAANGLTALFIACGQDVASVSESHAGVTYTQLLDNGDYYWS